MIDEIQNIFDSNKMSIDEIHNIADYNNANKFRRKIISTFDEIKNVDSEELDNSYVEYLANIYLKAKQITNKDIILFLIMLEYLKLAIKLNDLELFNEIISIAYKHAETECKKVIGEDKKTRPISVLNTLLMTIPNHLGWIWSEYIQNEINYNANQLFRQYMIDLSQNNDINLDNDIYKDIFDKQQRAHLNINDGKVSGGIESQTQFLVNKAILEVGQDYDMQKCKFIGVNDNKQTKMCDSLDDQFFFLNKMNVYQRYSDDDKRIVTYHTHGLVIGENLPPITNHFHHCRSTITYITELNSDEILEMKKKNETKYKDITMKFRNNRKKKEPNITFLKDNKTFEYEGVKYLIDGKNVKYEYSDNELDIAKWVNDTFNYDVTIAPKINYPENIKTPDFIFGNEKWDLKTITSNSNQALYHSVYRKEKQSNNFILDVSSSKLITSEIKEQINTLYNRPDTSFINKIIVKKDNDFSVYKRK